MLPATINKKSLTKSFLLPLPKYFTQDEVGMILGGGLRREDYSSWFLCLFLWSTGMRVSEALSVKVEDIDLMGKAVRVSTLKRHNHERVIPLQNGFVGEISIWINQNGLTREDKLFRFNRSTAFNKVRKACRFVGLNGKRDHPHTFRHSFAVNCITQGVPVTVLREWLGHRDITKTLIYTQVLAQDTRVFMDNVQF
jgi:site-specific recombinase XerD